MSELYLIFIAIGLLLFAAISGYSWMLQKKADAAREAAKSKEYVDPLFNDLERSHRNKNGSQDGAKGDTEQFNDELPKDSIIEPTAVDRGREPILDDHQQVISTSSELSAQDAGVEIKAPEGVAKSNVTPISSASSTAAKTASISTVRGAPQLDSSSSIVTELVARVRNTEAVEQHALLALFREHDFKFHRKVHIYGLNQLTDLWRDIELELPSARFLELGVAIQLADREGAMSKKELHDFQQMTLEFANAFDAPFEFSMEIDDAIKQAQILDQIGRRYDSMAVLNVVPRGKSGFRMADIESCARDLMMGTDKNGIFVKTRGQKQNLSILYRLACTDGSGHFGVTSGSMTPVHDLVIYMNVPATEIPDRVFEDMAKDANNLATWLDGRVVDKNGKVMTQRSYSMLLQQISDIAYSMQQEGLIPGDATSKKLF